MNIKGTIIFEICQSFFVFWAPQQELTSDMHNNGNNIVVVVVLMDYILHIKNEKKDFVKT